MHSHDIEKLIDKYLKRETNTLENDQVERWFAENKAEGTQWKELDAKGREQWINNLWRDIELTISQPDELLEVRSHKYKKAKAQVLWKKIAAVAAILFVTVTMFIFWPVEQKKIDSSHFSTLAVPAKLKKKITLDDGSVVWINSLGELRYPKKFTGSTREVFLSGEAFFDIRHEPNKPFIVHTGKVKTTVLGTAFNIKSNNPSIVIVTVTRGKVSVTDQSRLIAFITPNQQLVYNTKNKLEQKVDVNAQKVIAWREDLYFNNITFGEAATILQTRFNVKINFTNELVSSCRFSGTALEGNELDQILKVICAFNQATYKHNSDGSITINGTGCVN
ncbi:MAG: FecR domain-containing protein [Bacteroidota bacterium]